MAYSRLFVFVEGGDDGRFIKTIVIPMYRQEYTSVEVIEYRQKKIDYINEYVKSIRSMRKTMEVDYIFVCDMDDSACITRRKQAMMSQYTRLESHRIRVVIKEIEGWYLAGLDSRGWERLGLRGCMTCTEGVTKESFDRLMPSKFDNRIDFMVEMLKSFSHEVAINANASYRYFTEKSI